MSNPTGKGGFKKNDPRINRKGRPKSFDALRELAQQIAHEAAIKNDKCVVINGKKATVTEMILRKWATSNNTQLQRAFIEIAFGKVPDILHGAGDKGEIILKVVREIGTDDKAA